MNRNASDPLWKNPLTGTRWRHVKRGTTYEIICRSTREADETPNVVYVGRDGKVWDRPYAEFMDGRFEQISGAATGPNLCSEIALPGGPL